MIRTVAGQAADVAELGNRPTSPKGKAFAAGSNLSPFVAGLPVANRRHFGAGTVNVAHHAHPMKK